VFLTHVGPIALTAVKKSLREKSKPVRGGNRHRSASAPPVGHVIAMDYEEGRPNAFVKALGNWIGRSSIRRTG
jgi:hypothetical protein